MNYEELVANHTWDVPEHYNVAVDCCDKHPREKLAMVHEDPQGNVRRLAWGERQDMAARFAPRLQEAGVQKGDRVAFLMTPTPETAAGFMAAWKCGAIMFSMSSLYADDSIHYRLEHATPKV